MGAERVAPSRTVVVAAGTARGAGTGQALEAAMRHLAGLDVPVLVVSPRGAVVDPPDGVEVRRVGRFGGVVRDLIGWPRAAVWVGFCDRLPLWDRAARRVLVVQNPHLYGPVTPGMGLRGRARRTVLGGWARRSARRAHVVIASSSASRHDVLAAVPVDPARVVVREIPPLDVGIPKDSQRDLIEQVLLLGDLYPYKQFDRAVAGLDRYAEAAGRRLRVIHVGSVRDGAADASFDAAIRAARHVDVERRGRRPHPEVIDALRDADLLVFVSARETYGIPLAEALAVGLPVVCTDIGPFRDLADGVAAFVDPTAEPDDVAAAIRSLEPVAEREGRAAAGRGRTPTGGWDVVSPAWKG